MKWNFPITRTVKCKNVKCAKEFDITLVDRNSERHPCPDCGTVHVFDFEAHEKEFLKTFKERIRTKR